MYANKLSVVFLGAAEELYKSLSFKHRSKILGAIDFIQKGEFELVEVKTLKGPIKEFKVNQYRFLFCVERSVIYILRGFIKKSMKTARNEIEMAEKMYIMVINQINKNVSKAL